jgi:hypothetical protein
LRDNTALVQTGVMEPVRNAAETEERDQQEFLELAERFRASGDTEEIKRLGDQLGRIVFGD